MDHKKAVLFIPRLKADYKIIVGIHVSILQVDPLWVRSGYV